VIFPVNASVLSAFGTLVSPVRIDLARSLVGQLGTITDDQRERVLGELRAEGRRVLAAAGVAEGDVRFRYGIDARYTGQGNEITIWVGEGDEWPGDDSTVRSDFEREYRRIYGLTIPDVGVEIVTWRVSAVAHMDTVEPAVPDVIRQAGTEAVPHRTRPVVFHRGQPAFDVPVYRRESLGLGARFEGPAIVEERETTAVIRPGWSVEVAQADGSLIATRNTTGSGGAR
jgi:N-methylhydantoinase A